MTLRLCSIAAALALAFATSAQAQQTRDPATPKADRPATEKMASSDRKVKDAEWTGGAGTDERNDFHNPARKAAMAGSVKWSLCQTRRFSLLGPGRYRVFFGPCAR